MILDPYFNFPNKNSNNYGTCGFQKERGITSGPSAPSLVRLLDNRRSVGKPQSPNLIPQHILRSTALSVSGNVSLVGT